MHFKTCHLFSSFVWNDGLCNFSFVFTKSCTLSVMIQRLIWYKLYSLIIDCKNQVWCRAELVSWFCLWSLACHRCGFTGLKRSFFYISALPCKLIIVFNVMFVRLRMTILCMDFLCLVLYLFHASEVFMCTSCHKKHWLCIKSVLTKTIFSCPILRVISMVTIYVILAESYQTWPSTLLHSCYVFLAI